MGISGPFSNKEKAIEVATERCLQYLAFSRGLAMQTVFGIVNDSSRKDSSIEYNVIGGTSNDIVTETSKNFEIVNIQWLGGKIGAIVFAKLPEMRKIKVIDGILNEKLPKIGGCYVAIATSEISYTHFADAIEAATFRVAEALVDMHERTINVSNNIMDIITNPESSEFRSDAYSIFGNRLEGFAVLAYEYDIIENKVYALAVSKK